MVESARERRLEVIVTWDLNRVTISRTGSSASIGDMLHSGISVEAVTDLSTEVTRNASRSLNVDELNNRVALNARVPSELHAGEDKTSLTEQVARMKAVVADNNLIVAGLYQEIGHGTRKTRPEFQRMLADAKKNRFDIILCWSSDRLARGMYAATAVMEVVDRHDIRLMTVKGEIK